MIVFPRDLLDIARLLLGEGRVLDLGYCCPIAADPYIVVNATIASQSVEPDGRIHLVLQPLSIDVLSPPRPFTRLDSCIVEILVAYTRIAYHESCEKKLRELETIERCLDLLHRRARGERLRLVGEVERRIRDEIRACNGG